MEEVDRLRLFLIEIAKGAGAYKQDPLEHARAVIEDSINLARAALRDQKEGNSDVEWDGRSYMPPDNSDPGRPLPPHGSGP